MRSVAVGQVITCIGSLLLSACAGALPTPEFEPFDLKVTPDARRYPDVSGVVLLDRGTLTLTVDPDRKTPLGRLRRYRRVKILRPGGEALAQLVVPYDPGSAVHALRARTTKVDGRSFETAQSDVTDVAHDSGRRAKVLQAQDVELNSVIEHTYDLYIDDLRFIEPWVFGDVLPTVRSEFAVVVPNGFEVDLRFSTEGRFVERPPERFDTPEGTRFFWSESNLPAQFPEPDMPRSSLLAPRAHVLFHGARWPGREFFGFASWDDLALWFERRLPEWEKLSSATIQEATRVAGDASLEEKALRIAEVLARDLRREAGPDVPLWRARLPHPEQVLQEKQANRTSRGVTLVALLRAVGLPAFRAFVAYRAEDVLLADVPTVQTLGAIIAVVHFGRTTLFIDPSQLTISERVPPPSLQGTRIVVLRDDVTELVRVPISRPEDSRSEISYALELDERGRVQGSVEARLTGAEAGALRSLLFETQPEAYAEITARFLKSRGAVLAPDSLSISDLGALRRPLTFRGTVEAVVQGTEDDSFLYLPVAQLLGRPESSLRERRRTPLVVGAPRETTIEITLLVPEEHEAGVLPEDYRLEWSGGMVEEKARIETKRRFGFRRSERITELEIARERWSEYREHQIADQQSGLRTFSIKRPKRAR